MQSLKNKIVLITGASSGIGAACAHAFAQQGAKIILTARRKNELQALAVKLQTLHNVETLCLPLDVTKKDLVHETLQHIPTQWQPIDILINNAGLALGLDKIQDGDINDWDTMIDTNLKGLLYITKTILPMMVKRKQGHIINIGSISGHDVYSGGVIYCATKFAVNAITKGLKKDLLGTKVRVSSVDPGIVETDFSKVRFKGDEKRATKVYQGFNPLIPEDIADAVIYCATRPAHINIREMIVMPTDQASVEMVDRN